MELLEFRCPCRQKLEAPRTLAGRKAKCPTCRSEVEIPTLAPEAAEPLAEVRLVPCPACAEPIVEGVERCEHCRERLDWEKGRGALRYRSRATRWRAYRDRPGLPWDDRTRGTITSRLVDTLQALVFQPVTAFRATPPEAGFGQAWTFCIGMFLVAAVVSFGSTAALLGSFLSGGHGSGGAAILGGGLIAVILLVKGLIGPLITGLVLHVLLAMIGGARRSLDATMRATCFAQGATALVAAIPIVGPLVAVVWAIALLAIGLREFHEISGARALAATIPTVLLTGSCCCPMGLPGF